MITALIFIIVIGVLVFVHELGHFVMAKRAGMRVDEFGFGFPPRLWGIKRGGTIYSINWIPFGGFVKILGEDGGDRDNPGSFASKPAGSRLLVIIAGVVMNFFLAAFLLMLCNFAGLRIGLDDYTPSAPVRDIQIQIIQVAPASPAEAAGLALLDQIKGVVVYDGILKFSTVKEFQDYTRQSAGQAIKLVIGRGGETLNMEVTPRVNPPANQGALGISLAQTGIVSYPWYEAIWRGVYDAVILTINTIIGYFVLIKTLLLTGHMAGEVSGPVGIATLTGKAARIGISYLMQFTAMISINLAVLNIIPFPALDGGRALMIIIEKLKGSPVNKKFEQYTNTIGFALLIALMLYVTAKDIYRFF